MSNKKRLPRKIKKKRFGTKNNRINGYEYYMFYGHYKGIFNEIKDTPKIKSDLTIEKVIEVLEEMSTNIPKRQITFYQGCKTYGVVMRSSENLNICRDPTCSSCQMMNNALKEAVKNYLDEKW